MLPDRDGGTGAAWSRSAWGSLPAPVPVHKRRGGDRNPGKRRSVWPAVAWARQPAARTGRCRRAGSDRLSRFPGLTY